ncbi:hypothetical protein GBAR_LOCUS23121, partial [Geodia barretti]
CLDHTINVFLSGRYPLQLHCCWTCHKYEQIPWSCCWSSVLIYCCLILQPQLSLLLLYTHTWGWTP